MVCRERSFDYPEEETGGPGRRDAVERPAMFNSEINHAIQCLERAATASANPRDLRWVQTILRMTRMLLARRLPRPPG